MLRRSRSLHRAMLATSITLVGGLAGCGGALLSDNEPRSQYDRYDALRGQRPAPHIENEFGEDKPNLRGRLLRRD